MQTIHRAPLPIELVDLILKYAAEPTFAQPDRYDAKKPYSIARKLCLVSRGARRAVLPEMLRTVLLSSSDNVSAFVHALHMQEEYAQTYPALCFAYARYIHNIWIGDPKRRPMSDYFVELSVSESDLGLLAPVLLGAPSLAINLSSMGLLTRCVEHAWTHTGQTVDDQCSPLPWGTKTLTLSEVKMDQWNIATCASGSAFLASLAHLVVVPDSNTHVFDRQIGKTQDFDLHQWITHTPWASFKRLETISLAFPLVELPVKMSLFIIGTKLQTELLTFPASLVKGRIPLKIKASTETGEDCISLDDVRVAVSDSRVHFSILHHQWEKVWACGFLTEGGKGSCVVR